MAEERTGGKESRESERPFDFGEVIRSVQERRAEEMQSREGDPTARFERALESLPFEARSGLQARLEKQRARLLKEGVPEEAAARIIAENAEDEAARLVEDYADKRFELGEDGKDRIFGHDYAKMEIRERVDELLESDPTENGFRKIALLSFDANGLKAANDLSGSHKIGTEYLKRIVEVLHAPEGPTRKWLKEKGISKVLATTHGGDEYNVLLSSDKPIDDAVISEAIERFETEVSSMDVSDIVDFDDPEVLLRFGNVAPGEWARMDDAQKEEALRKIKDRLPPGAKFRATVSGGGAVLADAMAESMGGEGKNALEPGDSYRRTLDKIMGALLDSADRSGSAAKAEFKNSLRESSDAMDRFYGEVLVRTAEARTQEQKIAEMAAKNAAMERALAETAAMLEAVKSAGLPPDKVAEFLAAKMKELRG